MYDARSHYQTLYENVAAEFSFQATTPEELSAWQAAFRPRLCALLGLDRMAEDLKDFTPRAERLSVVDKGDYTLERWRLWVESTFPLPFYLLRPPQVEEPTPLVVTPHGHNHPHIYVGLAQNEAEEETIQEGERDIAVQAVREGYYVIAPTTRGFGETRTGVDKGADNLHSCRTHLMHGLLVGRTPIGERVWDMMRLIDWAAALPMIDAERIAMTGNSGGGTITLFAAACDPRIAVAMPGCYFCTFQGSIGSIHHCDCNYVPGILRLGEMHDVAGLIAPRPFCAIAGEDDAIFPIEHVRHAYERLKAVYTVAGVPERCELYVGAGGHRYYKDGVWPFLGRWF